MSYDFEHNVAKKILKDQGVYDLDAEAAKQTEAQNASDMAEFGGGAAAPPAALAPAAPDPRSFTYDAPADSPNTADQLRRYAGAGVSQNEAYRLLGGPRQRLGA